MTPGCPDTQASRRDSAGLDSFGDDESGRPSFWDAAVFWPIAIGLAVATWWPLLIHAASGLHGGDIYTYFFPLKAWYSDRLHAGEWPLWNPLVGNGFPALGESQTGVYYPFHFLFYRLFDLNTAYHANFLLHYVLAFGFACHYVRSLGYSLLEAILVGVIFVYGWFPARSCLEWAIVTGAWIPLAFWGVELFLMRGRRRCLIATQLAIVMQLLAGHFNLAFVTLVGVVVYTAARLSFEQRPWRDAARDLLRVATVGLLALAAAGIQLVPSWELKARSQRATSDFGERQVGYGTIPWSYLSQAIRPWHYYPHVREPAFEQHQFGEQNTNRVEAHLYFGLVPMCLAALATVAVAIRRVAGKSQGHDRLISTWLVVGLVALLLAVGWWTPWAAHLPGFGYFTGPGRYGVLVQLAVALMAGEGARQVRQWMTGRAARSTWSIWAATLAGCVLVAWAADAWTAWSGGAESLIASLFPVRAGWVTPEQCAWAVALACLILAVVSALARRPYAMFAVLAILLSWLDVTSVARFVQFADIRWDSPIQLRDASTVRRLLSDQLPAARVLARNQNAVSLCGVASVPVYLGIGPREYFGGPLKIPDEFHWGAPLNEETLRWLRWCGVTHILSFDPMPDDDVELVWMGVDPFLHGILGRLPSEPLWLYAVRGTRGRCFWVPAAEQHAALDERATGSVPFTPIADVREGSNEIVLRVQCPERAVVVLTELMYPGWEVVVNKRTVQPIADTVFRAVQVEAGEYEIVWRYRPKSLVLGLLLSFFAVVATYFFVVRAPYGSAMLA